MARYLVTGGCGFIGSHLVDRLIADGHDVKVLDNLSTGRTENLNHLAQLVIGDIRDEETVASLMSDVDGCFHLAAIASVEQSNEEWAECHTVNITGAINVFNAARATETRTSIPVVYASSAAVYGNNASMPLCELAHAQPLTAYGADKLSCELHGRVAWMVHRVPTTGLRFFNVYGPRQDPSSPYSGVISIFMDKVMKREAVTVFGDGGQCRDFVFVRDVVEFLAASMETTVMNSRVFNVCSGKLTSINDLVRTISKVANRPPALNYGPPRRGDIRISLGDPGRARRDLGVRHKIDLFDGIKETYAALSFLSEAA